MTHRELTTDQKLLDLIVEARAQYDAMTPAQKASHDYTQRRSFVRGMCPSRLNFDEWCRIVDRVLPPRAVGEKDQHDDIS